MTEKMKPVAKVVRFKRGGDRGPVIEWQDGAKVAVGDTLFTADQLAQARREERERCAQHITRRMVVGGKHAAEIIRAIPDEADQ